MAGTRLIKEVELLLQDGNRARRLKALYECNRAPTFEVTIQPGESKLQVLDDTLVTLTPSQTWSLQQYLFAESDVEGVQWWPIDTGSASPLVSPTMRAFGPLIDWDAPSFNHVHGAVPNPVVVDHDTTGQNVYHAGVFPHFMNFDSDKANAEAGTSNAFYYLPTVAPTSAIRIHYRGKVANMGCAGTFDAVYGNNRTIIYRWGMDNPVDLGTLNDGLGLVYCVYIADKAKQAHYNFTLSSYPYVSGIPEKASYPTTTPVFGDTVYSVNDRNLCQRNTKGGTVSASRGLRFGHGATATDLPAAVTDGYQTVWVPKIDMESADHLGVDAGPTGTPAGASCPVAGRPAWNRITELTFSTANLVRVPAGEGSASHLVTVNFGPQPGRLWTLRPFSFVTTPLFRLEGTKPAIGIRNPTSKVAKVRIEFGIQ